MDKIPTNIAIQNRFYYVYTKVMTGIIKSRDLNDFENWRKWISTLNNFQLEFEMDTENPSISTLNAMIDFCIQLNPDNFGSLKNNKYE